MITKYEIGWRSVSQDLGSRNLHADTKAAVLELGDINARIHRQILTLVLEKCMFLHHWSGKHSHVTDETSWDALVERGVGMILDLGITPEMQRRFTGQKA